MYQIHQYYFFRIPIKCSLLETPRVHQPPLVCHVSLPVHHFHHKYWDREDVQGIYFGISGEEKKRSKRVVLATRVYMLLTTEDRDSLHGYFLRRRTCVIQI